MTPLWVNQLTTMGANKHVKICQKFQETSMETSVFLLSVALSEATVRLSHDIHSHSRDHTPSHPRSLTLHNIISMKLQRNLHNNNSIVQGNMTNPCSRNLMRVSHKVSDHHLQSWIYSSAKLPWLCPTDFLIHLTVGVDILYIIKICPKYWANIIQRSAAWVNSVAFLTPWEDSVMMLATSK